MREPTSLAKDGLLLDRYRFVRELGRGGSGRVMLLEDRLTGDRWAAKVVSRAHGERLAWELSLLSDLVHPGLAMVHELVTVDARLPAPLLLEPGDAILLQEHAKGATADEAIAALPSEAERIRFVVRLALSVGRALGAVHARGLVHGDVKPANIVVGADPASAKLVDLGLARPMGIAKELSGTPGFLAPEAWLGERTAATDLYALGATVHALLSGRTAFDTERSEITLGEALSYRPTADTLPMQVPTPLRSWLSAILAEDPAQRTPSAREAVLRLAAIAADLGVEVDTESTLSRLPSVAERSARALHLPYVGAASKRRALTALLRRPGVCAAVGPPGSGRSRLIRQAVRDLQAELAAAGQPVPTFVSLEGPVRRVDHHSIVHTDLVDLEVHRAAVEAAAVLGARLTVVLELDAPIASVPHVQLGPLDDEALRALVRDLLSVDPSDTLLGAARAASGGLPGRLCRLIAKGHRTGVDPTRPTQLRDLGHADEGAAIPPAALRLAELLSVAGGSLGAPDARRAASALDWPAQPTVEALGSQLTMAGLAFEGPSGRLSLRADVGRALRLALAPEKNRALARSLSDASLDPLGRAYVALSLGRTDDAAAELLDAMKAARHRGDPERAAMIGRDALTAFDAAPTELVLATADALRASAREGDAHHLLEELAADREDVWELKAELSRLLREPARAKEEARRGGDRPGARAVLAQLALAEGAADEAYELYAGHPAHRRSPRLAEVGAYAALMLGRLGEAQSAVASALELARELDDPAAEARALSVEASILQSRGAVDRAAGGYHRAAELADRAGERHAAATFLVNVGLSRLDRGDAGGAIEALREGARRLVALGRSAAAARALYNLGNAAALVGDDALAGDALRRASRNQPDAVTRAFVTIVAAELDGRRGRLSAACDALDAAFGAADGLPEAVRVVLGARRAWAHANASSVDAARGALAPIEDLPADAAGAVERDLAVARVAQLDGDVEGAIAAVLTAAVAAETAGWESQLRASLAAGEILESAGRSAEADVHFARARSLLDQIAQSLPVHLRARLRSVPAYQSAFARAPDAVLRPAAPAELRWRALARHAKGLVREPRVARLYAAIVDAGVELADAERGFLVERTEDGAMKVRAARAFGVDLEGEEPSLSIAVRAMEGDKPLVAVDALSDERLEAAASVHAMALRSVLAVPVRLSPGRAAALVLDDRLRPGAFDDSVLSVVSDLADVAAGAIQRAEALRAERRRRARLVRTGRKLAQRVESAELELAELRRRASGPSFSGIVAESQAMRSALRLVERVAQGDPPVLIRGESGTGKELIARAVHEASPRRDGPYVSENVSAIPETLLESALFGHVRGAYTGAAGARKGLFEVADGGSLFLDEIGEMSESMQAKLLRVLQDGELRPIGAERTRQVDVRLIAATHRDLEQLVKDGSFREDLYYRIAVVQVELPPLRDRPEDVAPLVAAFLERHGQGRRVRIEPEAMAALRAFEWPGNVRQLENEVRRALVLVDDVVGVEHLSSAVKKSPDVPVDELDLKGQVDALERRLIRGALERTSGNLTRASKLLGLSRYGLQKMIKRLGVTRS